MIAAPDLDLDFPLATAGDIAVINLESARQQSWSRFWQIPQRPGIAEYIVEQEQMTRSSSAISERSTAFDVLVDQLVRVDAESDTHGAHSSAGRVDCASICRGEKLSAQAEADGALREAATRLLLSIDQACGYRLDAVLEDSADRWPRSPDA